MIRLFLYCAAPPYTATAGLALYVYYVMPS